MGHARGRVGVAHLAPGRYVIYRINALDQFFAGEFSPIALAFEVRPGRTTYLGNFRILGIFGKGALGRIRAWRLATSDQSARDLPLLRAKAPDLGEVDVAVPPALLLSRAPPKWDSPGGTR